MLPLVVAEGVAIALLAVLVAGLLRSHADILRSLHELGVATRGDAEPATSSARLTPLSSPEAAHDVTGTRLDGTAASIAVVGTRHDTLLAFLSSGCLTCRPFWESLRAGAGAGTEARVVVVAQDEDSRSKLRQLAGDDLDVLVSSVAWSDYGVPGSPHVVMVRGATGRVVGEGTATSWEQVVDLLGQAAEDGGAAYPNRGSHDNAERIDAELTAAGIGRGHPSLSPERPT